MTPKLRFSDFKGEWTEKRLGTLISLISGQHLGPDDYDHDPKSGLPYFTGPTDFTNNLSAVTKFTNARVKTAHTNEILITVKGSGVGALWRLKLPKVAIGRQLMAIQGEDADNGFLFTRLQKLKKHFEALGSGNMIPGLSRNDIKSLKISFPPSLLEQQKIAAFVGAVDSRIGLLQQQRKALERYKTGMMQLLFAQTVRFKRDDGTAFPDWSERSLGSVFDWISTNSLSREMLTDEPGGIQNIHYGDIHGRFPARFKQSEQSAPFVKQEALSQPMRAEQFCSPGDVVIADASEDYADIGKSIEIIEAKPQSLVAGLHTHLARPKANTLVLGFSGYLFQTWTLRNQIMRIAQGISVLGISKTNLSKLMIGLPHPDEQRRIADFLGVLDDKIGAVSAKVEAMQTFKKGLLQQMFV